MVVIPPPVPAHHERGLHRRVAERVAAIGKPADVLEEVCAARLANRNLHAPAGCRATFPVHWQVRRDGRPQR
jgi:hypothetical protein